MVRFTRKHPVRVTIGVVVVAIIFVAVSEWGGLGGETAPVQLPSGEETAPVQSGVVGGGHVQRLGKTPLPPPKNGQPVRQSTVSKRAAPSDTAETKHDSRQDEELDRRRAELQREIEKIRKRMAQIRQDEARRTEARGEQLHMLEDHARQLEALGNTLRQVFKTPRQIRIMATDLKREASALRAQIQSQDRTAGPSSIDREIWTAKRSVMDERAADLEATALSLQRTGGEPSKVRIAATQILENAKGLRTTIENKKQQKRPLNNELVTLEEKQEALQQRIRELEHRQQEKTSQGG